MKLNIFPLLLSILFPLLGYGQNSISIENYERAVSYRWDNLNNKKTFNLDIRPNWLSDSTGLWYVHQAPNNKQYLKISFPDFKKSPLFDQQKLAKVLSDSLGKEIKANALPIERLRYKNSNKLEISVENKNYILSLTDYSLDLPKSEEEQNEFESLSPDKKWVAYTKDYNLYIKNKETHEIKQLSTLGEKGYEYASWYGWADIMEGENGKRPERFYADWSEDGKWIYANICDFRTAQKMYLLDWSQDTLYRPRLLSYYRGSPGDTTMVYQEPVFFNIDTGKEIKPNLPVGTHINSVEMVWSSTPGKVFLLRHSRGYKNLFLYSFDLNTGKLQKLYEESSNTNIDFLNFALANENSLLFFLSEKSGWKQLYSLNLKTKEVRSITKGAYYINDIKKIDKKNKRIFFTASGKEQGRNPYHQHLYSISYNGRGLKLLTKEDLHHQISISPDRKYFVANSSSANRETITQLRDTRNGKILAELGNADVSRLVGWTPPQVFTVKAGDGKTDIYGAFWKPTNFDPNKKYPIIDHSYTGPHTQVFPKSFRDAIINSNQSLAELGFVVLRIDGRGSSGRSKEFHNYSYKNLGGTLDDHIEAIRQLGSQYSWIDTTKVGIFGHSAGGYDAGHAVLAYPDFYKVAVASSADHDHRMEKAWWPEMYMGWPVDSAYHLQSNITIAGNLKGKLLITHGGIDENVNPSATFKLAEALIKADKEFDMLILPSQRHGYSGDHRKYFIKRRWNYFVKHLLNLEPIWDFEWEPKEEIDEL
ncbi:S9 family peptidase [Xanthovirga aplysinae]|uniref:S9 family peptidase n=1 Tax=Xanthovirga aplysinae TaxID=2529853 RepID=UPI0012BCC5CB|nr:prolyl oligopeptidase family serine peptidase [Xanthovirga aplysinae]MTI33586.1 S9 family peptidase [Xanthovirga aplysinae]